MKRSVYSILIFLLFAGSLNGCSFETPSVKNEIAPQVLTEDQKDIIHILSGSQLEMLLFDYQIEAVYTNMECWVETYEYGVLSERQEGMSILSSESDTLYPDGQLAVLIQQDSGTKYTFSLRTDGTLISNDEVFVSTHDSWLGRGYGPITAPVSIEPGKEIVLYTSVSSSGSIASFDDPQRYATEPELLKDYPQVQLIKCIFN